MACTSLQLTLLPTFSVSELFISSSAAISLFYWSSNHLKQNFCSPQIPPGTVKKKIKFNFLWSPKLFNVPQPFFNELIFPDTIAELLKRVKCQHSLAPLFFSPPLLVARSDFLCPPMNHIVFKFHYFFHLFLHIFGNKPKTYLLPPTFATRKMMVVMPYLKVPNIARINPSKHLMLTYFRITF